MRRVALAVFGTIAGLVGLLSFKTHEPTAAAPMAAVSTATSGPTSSAAAGPTPASSTTGSTTATASPSSSSSTKATATATAKATATATAKPTTKTVTGSAVDTRWGPVQVKITVTDGKVTSASAVEYPQNNGRDQEINATAVPTLEKESIGVSKSSAVDAVSGATYTSQGYIGSLQSALDKAGL